MNASMSNEKDEKTLKNLQIYPPTAPLDGNILIPTCKTNKVDKPFDRIRKSSKKKNGPANTILQTYFYNDS